MKLKKELAPVMGNVWLLTWNPKNWEWNAFHEWAAGTKLGKRYIEPWTVMSKKITLGDKFFLMKTSDAPRGIIAHGRVVKEPYSAPHYDPEKASRGKMTNHIDAEFDWIIDYMKEPLLSQGILKTVFPSQQWSPQGSGISIRQEIAEDLKQMWYAHIERELDS